MILFFKQAVCLNGPAQICPGALGNPGPHRDRRGRGPSSRTVCKGSASLGIHHRYVSVLKYYEVQTCIKSAFYPSSASGNSTELGIPSQLSITSSYRRPRMSEALTARPPKEPVSDRQHVACQCRPVWSETCAPSSHRRRRSGLPRPRQAAISAGRLRRRLGLRSPSTLASPPPTPSPHPYLLPPP